MYKRRTCTVHVQGIWNLKFYVHQSLQTCTCQKVILQCTWFLTAVVTFFSLQSNVRGSASVELVDGVL